MGKLWGGRFSKPTNKLVEEFTNSIHFDHKLAKYDVIGSLCHIDVLKKAGLLTAAENTKLKKALNSILKSIENGSFQVDPSFEDIHSYIQHLVEQKAGKVGLKLHTCRSRNDQVVFDVKVFCAKNNTQTSQLIASLSQSLETLANRIGTLLFPGTRIFNMLFR